MDENMNTIGWAIALYALMYNDCKMRQVAEDYSMKGKVINVWLCLGCLIMMIVCTFK